MREELNYLALRIVNGNCCLPVGKMLIGERKVPVAVLAVAFQWGMDLKEVAYYVAS
jgi:hypothetical protein